MAHDLEEQEQIDAVKDWWKKYGNLVTWVVIACLLGYSAFAGWKYYQRRQAAQASQLYSELTKAVSGQDTQRVLRASADMQDKFSSTTYAQMSGALAAKALFDAGDVEQAKGQLRWVAQNAQDDAYKSLAKIRLAGILLDQKSYQEALELVSGAYPTSFAALALERKGDILFAQKKLDEARVAYQTALDGSAERDPGRQLIQLKLDGLGTVVKPQA